MLESVGEVPRKGVDSASLGRVSTYHADIIRHNGFFVRQPSTIEYLFKMMPQTG